MCNGRGGKCTASPEYSNTIKRRSRQIINTPDIANYPVAPNISGFDFATTLYKQAKDLGTEVKFEKVTEIQDGDVKTVVTPKNTYEAKAVILATGAENRKLGVEGEDVLIGKGVSYCATCDGNFYRKKTVAVAGGGNTAVEDALYLADLAAKVYLIHRRDAFRADAALVSKLKEKENVEFVLNANVTKLVSEGKLKAIEVTDKLTGEVTREVVYMTADVEDNYMVAQANEPLTEDHKFARAKVNGRYRDQILEIEADKIDFMDVSPKMVVSVATACIPFLENDDANRALMGSNMQRQAVPLLKTESPIVGTGMEYKACLDSGVAVVSDAPGVVESVDAEKIVVKEDTGEQHTYQLTKFKRSNAGTCTNQRPIVSEGERITGHQIIGDGPATCDGELSLGKNALIGFMTWEGYNYEDAVLLNENLVKQDRYTSVHIEEYEIEARDTKLGPEEITRDIPNVGEDALKDLDENGIIRIGAEVRSGDILVGKVTPKGETELTAEERLLRAIFGEKAREVRDNSLKVPHGEAGIIIDVKVFTRENCDELSPGVNKLVRCYIAQKRKISVGDKMAGRHGNKGVVSRILPQEDMPFLEDGTPLDIVLNPLGVPSRMNIGQVLEIHLSLAAKALGFNISTPIFDGANEKDIMDTLDMANDYVNGEWSDFKKKYKDAVDAETMQYLEDHLDHREEWKGVPISRDGKVRLRDGRTGEYFDSPVTIGHMHYLKLHHLVDDKIHARSTGPYSLVTQQPLGGKAQFGGQRFGEMEVWALEAYGAAYTLQEILTVKSDDVVGRVKTYEAIIKGENIAEPGIPESFKVLIKELQSLALDIRVLKEDDTEVELKESIEDEPTFNSLFNEKNFSSKEEFSKGGYTTQEFQGEELVDVEEDDDDSSYDDLFDDEDSADDEE